MNVYSRKQHSDQPVDARRVAREVFNVRTKKPVGCDSDGSYSFATTRPLGNALNVSARTNQLETSKVSNGFTKYRSGVEPEKVQ